MLSLRLGCPAAPFYGHLPDSLPGLYSFLGLLSREFPVSLDNISAVVLFSRHFVVEFPGILVFIITCDFFFFPF